MATINLGSLKFNWTGAYNSGTSYAVDDVATANGNSYVCIQAHSNQAVGNATAYWNIMSSAGTNGTDGSDGTDVSTTLTTQSDLLYRDGSGLQRLPKGTANQLLRINSGATAPEWHTPATVTSDFTKLATGTATGSSASISIDGFVTSDYKRYTVIGYGLRITGAGDLQIRANTGGSANTGNNYVQTCFQSYTDNSPSHSLSTNSAGNGTLDLDNPSNLWDINADNFTDDAGNGADVTFTMYDPFASDKWKNNEFNSIFVRDDKATIQKVMGLALFRNNTRITGVTFTNSGGNLYGTFAVYGWKI